MGLLKSKSDKVSQDAVDAIRDGMPLFVCKLTYAAEPHSGGIDSWTEAVASVEAAGWKLDRLSVTEAKGWLTAVLLFRRD